MANATTAKPSAPAAGAPASQQENSAAINTGTIEQDQGFTDALLAELGDAPARPKKKSTTPEGDEPEGDEPEGANPEGAAPEGDEPEANAQETDGERLTRLGQQENESDEDYAARLETEGVDATEIAAEIEEARQLTLQQQEGESDEDYATRLEAEGVNPADVKTIEPKVPKNLQKRFDELTGKIHKLTAENERLKTATPAQTRAPSSIEEEVQQARTIEQLDQLQARYEAWEEFALQHPDGHEIPGKDGGEPTVYTAEQSRAILVNMRRALRAIPAQVRAIEAVQAQDIAAHKAFPAYANPDSPMSKAYDAIVQRAPALVRAMPDLKLFVADALRGRELRTKGIKPGLPGKPAVRVQAPPPGGRGAPLRGKPPGGDAKAQQQARSLARVEKTGSVNDLASVLEGRLGG